MTMLHDNAPWKKETWVILSFHSVLLQLLSEIRQDSFHFWRVSYWNKVFSICENIISILMAEICHMTLASTFIHIFFTTQARRRICILKPFINICFYSTKLLWEFQNSLLDICFSKGIVAIFVPLFLISAWGWSKIHTTQCNFEHNYIHVWNCDTTVTRK